jgi:hypothetical protein
MLLPRLRTVIIVVAASAVATFGVAHLVAASDTPSGATDLATMDNLTARVATAGWTNMDHDMDSDATGYQMPPAMMPGMPEGSDERLAISVTVVNTSEDTRLLSPGEEFALHAGKEGKQWRPHSDTFGDLPRLAPHNAVTGMLYFDLPAAALTESLAWIDWTHGGTTSRLTIPMDGVSAPEAHSHNS